MFTPTFRPSLDTVEDPCTPSTLSLGGQGQLQLLLEESSVAALLPNETSHRFPPHPIFGLLTAATPHDPIFRPSPIIPTSFQGVLGSSAV